MGPQDAPVKAARDYDASGRRERADARRHATFDVAEQLFLRDGYAATTVDAIARAAAVSPATIYKSYGGKVGLLRSLCRRALAGAGPVPAEERSNVVRTDADPERVMQGWQRLIAEVAPRILPLLLVLHDVAGTDPEAQALREEIEAQRLERMADNARSLATAGHLRPGVSHREARDILWLASSPELYDLLVRRRGWSVSRYSRHMTEMMRATLL